MPSEFHCDSCGKTLPESERAVLGAGTRILFLITNVILAGVVTWSSDICRRCVRQRYLLSGLVLLGVLMLVAFFL